MAAARDTQTRPLSGGGERYVFVLVNSRQRIELEPGERIIGRALGSDVHINDPLVSRRHARLDVEEDMIFIEDLLSANGVLVNDERIDGLTRLRPGDRIMVGDVEFTLASYARGARSSRETNTNPASATVPGGEEPAIPSTASPLAAIRPDKRPSRRPGLVEITPDEVHAQARAPSQLEGLTRAVRLADRMFSMGRGDAAEKLLGPHLEAVVAPGAEVPTGPALEVVASAGLRLATVLQSGRWAALVLEAHTAAARPLPAAALSQFEALLALGVAIDPACLRGYQRALAGRADEFGKAEAALVERIQALGGA